MEVADAKRRLMEAMVVTSNGCWERTQGREQNGYARIMINRRRIGTHRLSYETFVGPIGKKWVLHRCDNPPCFNPSHLFLGNQSENLLDCRNKGRLPSAKLDFKKAADIRCLAKQGKSFRAIGRMHGVHHRTIGDIVRGIRWKQ